MQILYRDKLIAYLTLLSGLSISVVAIYYSVAGLISIFSASVVPIIIMGVTLEVSKLIATVWLKQNWSIAPFLIKSYLLAAIIVLMTITSMGIYGFLAKSHSDQSAPSKDLVDKQAVIDEKISTQKENIEVARRALTQLDSAVDQTMIRSTSEQGANRAVAIRKTQAKERQQLQLDITSAQETISKLNEQKAPISAALRNVEVELGPLKYIAALLYGDNMNEYVLDHAVQWVIILIVVIFDPLAVTLLLASQYSFNYFKKINEDVIEEHEELDEDADINSSEKKGSAVRYKVSKIPSSEQIKLAKRKFKEENPGLTLRELQKKKDMGLIDKLPWEK